MTTFPLGTIRGISIRMHWSWVIIFLLITASLATAYFPHAFRSWSVAEYWLVSAAAAIPLFVSVLIHELSHSFVARRNGLEVDSITLYIFGGAANLPREPDSARSEFWVSLAGPLASLGIGAVCGLVYAAVHHPDWVRALFGYLSTINVILAFFNLVPAFPMDGGRVLRSAAWGYTHSRERATRLALRVSEWTAWGFILLGIWTAMTTDFVGGVWLALIGWFLQASARSYGSVQGSALARLRVSDAMNDHPASVDPEVRLDAAVREHLLHQDDRALLVLDEERLRGLLTVADIQQFPVDQWPVVAAWRAMTPAEKLDTVTPETPLTEALRLMGEHGRDVLPVVRGDVPVGMLSRSRLSQYLRIRHDLGLDSAPPPEAPAGRGAA